MKNVFARTLAAASSAFALGATSPASATDDSLSIRIGLSGYQEVPTSLSTPGRGAFRATVDVARGIIDYELEYSDLPTPVTQAHIHFGQQHTNGAIVLFLCSNLAPPAGVPLPASCPGTGGVVKGTLRAANVGAGAAAAGIAAGEIAEIIAAIRAGAAYVNVHTTAIPAGELRGQLDPRRRHQGHHHGD
jgi:hypothetical protein